jgi:hypothetical protein
MPTWSIYVSLQGARLHKTWAEVQGQVSSAIAAYDAGTSGPTKWPRLTVFLQQQYGHMVADFVQKCEADAERKVGCCCCCTICLTALCSWQLQLRCQ